MRRTRGMDGRNPYGSRGGYVSSNRPRRTRRGDRGMDYGDYEDMRNRGRNDYDDYDMRNREYDDDMRNRMDGHYGRQGYEPVEFMGYCSGYAGGDFARGGRSGRGGYDRRGYDYGYDYGDYGDDYGQTLSDEELERWNKRLLAQLDEREKQLFHKDTIMQKAKSMGKQMDGFSEKELYTATLMCYTDYKNTIGQNPDLAMKLAYDWLSDKDVAIKGAEKLAVYYDCIVEGE